MRKTLTIKFEKIEHWKFSTSETPTDEEEEMDTQSANGTEELHMDVIEEEGNNDRNNGEYQTCTSLG